MIRRFLLILVVLGISKSLSAQTRIYGIVVNKHGKSIPGASIMINNSPAGTISDYNGHFNLIEKSHSTELSVKCSFIGYRSDETVIMPEKNYDYKVKIVLLKNRQKRYKKNNLSNIDKVLRT